MTIRVHGKTGGRVAKPKRQNSETNSPKGTTSVDVEVGCRMRLERQRANLSQTAIANAMGVTFQQVQKYEKGTNRVGIGRLTQIAEALKVPISTFFVGPELNRSYNASPSTAEILAKPYALRMVNAFNALPLEIQRTLLFLA